MLRIHWLAVTVIPSDACMLGRPTWVAAMSMAHVERPAAAAKTAMRLTAGSIACGADGWAVDWVLGIISLTVKQLPEKPGTGGARKAWPYMTSHTT